MRKPISLTIMGLALLAVASTKDQTLFVYLIGFLVALALYFIAVAVLLALAASPVIIAGSLWLYKRHRHGKPAPAWLKSLRHRATRRFHLLHRITASGRAAKQAWRQSASSKPAASGDRDSQGPDTPNGSPSTAAA
jgi:hypothetical protein